MAAYFSVLLLFCVPLCSSSFSTGYTIMPFPSAALAIGYDISNDTVLLFGGSPYPQQFTMFKPNTNTFINRGEFFLTNAQKVYSHSQHYTQLNHQLWIIRDDGRGFTTFDTKTYTATSPFITIPTDVNLGGCLTSVDNHLIVIGGTKTNNMVLNDVQIYRLSDDQWLSNIPSLTTGRTALSCVTLSNKVYAIGGFNGIDVVDTIDVLDVSNIDIPSFTYWYSFSARLSRPRWVTRAAVYGTDIYVVGGFDTDLVVYDDVDIINTITDSSMPDDPLITAFAYASCIIVGDTLFVFGGADQEYAYASYQYSILPTSNPTSMLTNTPTSPTYAPINYPTISPFVSTMAPTELPTVATTISPAKPPTQSPTKSPTGAEMCYPQGPCDEGYMDRTNGAYYSWNCGLGCVGGDSYTDVDCICVCVPENVCTTSNPIIDTIYPTKNPTDAPIKDASNNPTLFPSIYPSSSPLELYTELPSTAPTQGKDGEVQESTVDESTLSTVDVSWQERAATARNNSTLTVVTLVVGVVCIICCIVSVIGYYKYFWKTQKTIQNIKNNMTDEGTEKNGEQRSHQSNIELEDNNGVKMVKMNSAAVLLDEKNDNADAMSGKKGVGIMPQSDSDDDDLLQQVNATIGSNQFSVDSAPAMKSISSAKGGNSLNGNDERMGNSNVMDDDDGLVLDAVPQTMGAIDEFVIGSDSDNDDDVMGEMMTRTAFEDGENEGSETVETFMEGMRKFTVNEEGAKEVKAWLGSIGFIKYYDVFIKNGFDSMEFVKEINDAKDLDGIGISLRAHQLKIVNQIKKLNSK